MTGHTARRTFLPTTALLLAVAGSLSLIPEGLVRAQAPGGTAVFEGARIINGTGGPVIENGVLVDGPTARPAPGRCRRGPADRVSR